MRAKLSSPVQEESGRLFLDRRSVGSASRPGRAEQLHRFQRIASTGKRQKEAAGMIGEASRCQLRPTPREAWSIVQTLSAINTDVFRQISRSERGSEMRSK